MQWCHDPLGDAVDISWGSGGIMISLCSDVRISWGSGIRIS